jgi:endonuclease G, mitochondrial
MKAPPESITSAVSDRIAQAKPQMDRAIRAIQSNRPLDAEPEMARKVHRIQSVTGLSAEQAESIARYKEPVPRSLAGERRLAAERIQGTTADFVGFSFLEMAMAAGSTVARVVLNNLQPLGSGFMISENLFLTNNHVISNPIEAQQVFIEFNYEMDIYRQPKIITRFRLAPGKLFITNPEDKLDFTIVAVGERVNGTHELSYFGFCPLLDTDDKHALGEFVNIIQHPNGRYKEVVLRENQLVARLDAVLHYMADTLPGSSGSPVFNDQWEVIAIHHWGEPTIVTLPDGQPAQKDVNEGVRISAIIKVVQSEMNGTNEEVRAMLDAALKPSFRCPSSLRENIQSEKKEDTSKTLPMYSDIGHRVQSDGAITWRIPLDISIRLGDSNNNNNNNMPYPQPSQKSVPVHISQMGLPALEEAIQIDGNYSNRSGYNPKFLDHNQPVALPSLSDDLKERAARKLHVDNHNNEDPHELKYQHFSIIMSASRRMPFFTAVNIDGSKWIDIDRGTGEPREAEAREIWFIDPRIDLSAQCNQNLYDNQQPQQVFDRGHLVRRQDPSWGTVNRAIRANADTFHFTNCAPQESAFNRRSQFWQEIENYILDNAKAENERVSVFTGPVFDDNDPQYRYVKVPMQFWKILVRMENGQLLATALLADQSPRIKRMPERLESFDDMSKVAEYQVSVQEIERLTGLDFGNLRSHDTFNQGLESRRKLEAFEDIKLS